MQGAAIRLEGELMSMLLSANRTLTRPATPPTKADQVQHSPSDTLQIRERFSVSHLVRVCYWIVELRHSNP
jgi:hypothetical protein